MNCGSGEVAVSGEVDFLRRVRAEVGERDAVIFDVGANNGQYAEQVLKVFPNRAEIHCFEPSPAARDRFSQAFPNRPGLRLHPFALGSSTGRQELHAVEAGGSGSSLHPMEFPDSPSPYDRAETIDVRTLDDVCEEFRISRIDLLKIDTEGHELFVLQGGRRMLGEERIPRIQFEFGPGNIASRTYFLDFYRLLTPRYRLFRLLRDGLRSVEPYRLHLENFVTANYVALSRDLNVRGE
jgi:FkbM family methyltransferase